MKNLICLIFYNKDFIIDKIIIFILKKHYYFINT